MSKLQALFRDHFPAYAQSRKLPLAWHQAASAIARCHTEFYGGYLESCEAHPEESYPHYFGCKHRACPHCAAQSKAHWLDRQMQKLLDAPHAHIIFTLPHSLLSLWRYNRRALIDLQFRTSLDTLQTLLDDERYLGATPGIIATLHTHGRDLGLHPHIHCLVSAGGLNHQDQWQSPKKPLLLPGRVVQSLYRGKFLAGLKQALNDGDLALPPDLAPPAAERLIADLYRKPFNVKVQPSYRQGRGVLIYLSRYIKGGPLDPRRVLQADGRTVSFRYTSHTDAQPRVMTLPTAQFFGRLLTHAPLPGKPTVRYAGLYSPRQSVRLNAYRALNGGSANRQVTPPTAPTVTRHCPQCNQPLRITAQLPKRRLNFLYNKSGDNSGSRGGVADMSNKAFEHTRTRASPQDSRTTDIRLFLT